MNYVSPEEVADVASDFGRPTPSPEDKVSSRQALFVSYLDYFRATIIERVRTLSIEERATSHVASGWTPLELLKHLTFVERRWLEWGFLGIAVEEPWGEWRDDRWWVAADETFESLVNALNQQGRRTTEIVLAHELECASPPGPRFGLEPATLERILFHLLQEYARHAGHVDVVVEQAAGA